MRAIDKILAAASVNLALILAAGTAVAQTAPSDFTMANRYDDQRRLIGTIAPDPDAGGLIKYAATRYTYDLLGRLSKVENGELAAWQSEAVTPASWAAFTVFSTVDFGYDVFNQKIQETLSAGGTVYEITQYSYDAVGRLECTALRMNPAAFGTLPPSACTLGATGSNGPDRITRNEYDAAGQLMKIQKAYGVTTGNGFPATLQQDYATYTYSADGKQASITDANGNKAEYGYDGFDRLVKWSFPDKVTAGTVSSTDFEAYGYDPNGNRTSFQKRDGRTLTYSYDALNRVTSKIIPDNCPTPQPTPATCVTPPASAVRDVYYGYDLRGMQTYARFDSAIGNDAVVNAYDGFGRLSSSTLSMGSYTRALQYEWDADGNRTRVTHPDGNYFTYEHDGLDRLNAIKESGSTQVASLTYDVQGRRKTLMRGTVTTTYDYDPVSRISSLSDDLAGTSADVASTYAYNAASQITSYTRTNDTYAFNSYLNVSRPYAANGLNQYTTAGSGGSAATFTYDGNGNLTSDGTSTFVYDAENRLISMSGAKTAQFVYDPMGRLYDVGIKQFLYDRDELVGEYLSATGALYKRYVHGAGDDDPLLHYTGSGLGPTYRLSMQSDHQGSIVSLADASGNSLIINRYDEYGIPAANNAGRFQYTGQAWMPEIGMYYYKARIYSPTMGRFLQADPVGYTSGTNLYAYVGNDPINGRDPDGLDKTTCAITVVTQGNKEFINMRCHTSPTESPNTTIVFTRNGKKVKTVVVEGQATRDDKAEGRVVKAIKDYTGFHVTFTKASSTQPYLTDSDATPDALARGWVPLKQQTKGGTRVWFDQKTGRYYTRERPEPSTGRTHNGGVWKAADSPEELNSRETRLGSYDRFLNRIGD